MQTFLQDLRHALRLLRDSPGFSFTVIAALTLGIGSNTAIFSVVNAVILEPVPFEEPDRMVRLMNSHRATGAVSGSSSPAKFMHWRAQTDVLEDVAAVRPTSLNYLAGDRPERVRVNQVSEAFFRAFRAPVNQGRGFTPGDDLPGAPLTVVLGYDFWAGRLSADPEILGKTLALSGDEYAVIGVVGEDFDLREFGDPDVFVPFQLDPNTTDHGNYFMTFGRLRPGVTIEQAQQRLEASAAAFRERFPDAIGENVGFTVRTLQESLVGPVVRRVLWVLLGAVGFVLLIACANVASLLLVRATGRSREIAIRTALGAGRGRILRQLLTESVALSLVGGAFGLVAGYLGIQALLRVSTAGLPRVGDESSLLGMDWRVVTFTVALSLVTGIVFGLVPALVSSRTDLSVVIKDAGSRSGSGFGQSRTRSALVVAELGLCVVLLVGAALMIRTSLAISRVDPGFTTENVLTMRTSMSDPRFVTSGGVEEIARQALERIEASPGVASATATCCVPLQGALTMRFNVIGRENDGPYAFNVLILASAPMAWAVRTQVQPSSVSTAIQEELERATGLPVTDVVSMEQIVEISTLRQRLSTLLMSIFGSSALLLAAIGIYGSMAYTVQQRAREIGIRMAMGADSGTVRAMVVKQGMFLVGVGMVVGLVAAFFLANVLATVLFEVEPRDPVVFGGVTTLLAAIGLAAVALPALRASRVDPVAALRAN